MIRPSCSRLAHLRFCFQKCRPRTTSYGRTRRLMTTFPRRWASCIVTNATSTTCSTTRHSIADNWRNTNGSGTATMSPPRAKSATTGTFYRTMSDQAHICSTQDRVHRPTATQSTLGNVLPMAVVATLDIGQGIRQAAETAAERQS